LGPLSSPRRFPLVGTSLLPPADFLPSRRFLSPNRVLGGSYSLDLIVTCARQSFPNITRELRFCSSPCPTEQPHSLFPPLPLNGKKTTRFFFFLFPCAILSSRFRHLACPVLSFFSPCRLSFAWSWQGVGSFLRTLGISISGVTDPCLTFF